MKYCWVAEYSNNKIVSINIKSDDPQFKEEVFPIIKPPTYDGREINDAIRKAIDRIRELELKRRLKCQTI